MLIVFDLDGTLIDTAPDLVDTLNVILAREGLEPIPFEQARGMIGAGARRLLERGLRRDAVGLPGDMIERLYKDFLKHYSEHMADRSRAFPGLEPALDALAGAGHQFAVCTNKLESLSVELLKALNLAQRFSAICGQDTFGMQKPDPEVLRRTIHKAGGEPGRAIMVGDSGTDVRTARNAALPVIAVTFGYSEVPIESLRPDRLISSYGELRAAIDGIETAPAS